jgi:hypothetical protein
VIVVLIYHHHEPIDLASLNFDSLPISDCCQNAWLSISPQPFGGVATLTICIAGQVWLRMMNVMWVDLLAFTFVLHIFVQLTNLLTVG